MNKEVISDKQGISLIIIFLVGTSSLTAIGLTAKQDFWVSIILSMLITLPFAFIYSHLHIMFSGKNLFEVFEIVFGKFFGKVIMILYTFFFLEEGAEVLFHFKQFINITSLQDTPSIVIVLSIITLCTWVIKEGMEVIGRYAEKQLYIFIGLIAIAVLFLMPDMNINNIRPILSTDTLSILKGAHKTFAFPFGEIIIFAMFFLNFKSSRSPYRIYITGVIMGGIVILIIALTNVLALGVDSASSYYFPTYIAATRIDIGEALQRIEVVISLAYVLGAFIKLSVYLLATSKGLAMIFGYNDYRLLVIPAGLLMINLSSFLFASIMDFWEFDDKIWIFYAIPFEVIIPITVFIIVQIKKKRSQNIK